MSLGKYVKYISYSVFTYIGSILNAIVAIVVRRILDPYDVGMLTIAQIIYNYLDLTHLGARFALDIKVPKEFSKEKRIEIYHETFKLGLLFFVVSICVISIGVYTFFHGNIKLFLTIIIMEISFFFIFVSNFIKSYQRAIHNIEAMNFYAIVYPLLFSLYRLVFLLIIGYWGYVIGYLVNNITFFIIYRSRFNPFQIKSLTRIPLNFSHLRIGFNMFIYSLINVISITMDRWIVFYSFGTTKLGIYSTAVVFMSFALLLPNSLSEISFPKILQKQKILTPRNFFKYWNMVVLGVFSLIIVSIVVVELLLPSIISLMMPKYIKAIPISKILIAQVPFFYITSMSYYTLMGINRKFLPFLFHAFYITSVFIMYFIKGIENLESLALIILYSRIFSAFLAYLLTARILLKR